MKRQIVATLTIGFLVVAAVAAACSAPARVAPITTTTEKPAVPQVPTTQVRAVTDQERLIGMQSAIGMLINDSLNHGQAVPDYLFEQTQKIEQARLALHKLDGQREGLSMLVMQYCNAGSEAPDCVFDLLNSVQDSRQEILAKVGLVQ